MIDLGLIGGPISSAVAVNVAGQVAGQSTINDQFATHAVIWNTSDWRDDVES
jgi:uncharacterized membrane protein